MMDGFKKNKQISGKLAEKKARDFLEANRLKFITQNYHCPYGEIDLIMRDNEEIVFIEVRLRTHDDYGTALESIDIYKQRKLLNTATHFLQKSDWLDKVDCRFDVIGYSEHDIDWIKDAFSYE